MSLNACVVDKPIARPRTVAICINWLNSSAESATPSSIERFAVSIKSYCEMVPRLAVVSASRMLAAFSAPPAICSKLAFMAMLALPSFASSTVACAACTPNATRPAAPATFANAEMPPDAVPAALSSPPKSCLTLFICGLAAFCAVILMLTLLSAISQQS